MKYSIAAGFPFRFSIKTLVPALKAARDDNISPITPFTYASSYAKTARQLGMTVLRVFYDEN
jgi:hypothetical protein